MAVPPCSPSSLARRGADGTKRTQIVGRLWPSGTVRRAMQSVVHALGGKTLGMVVIARFPRLDEPVATGWPEVLVVPGDAPFIAPVTAVTDVPGQPGVGFKARARRPRAPFPVVSTLVLVVLAGGLWAAVWRDEQRRAADERQHGPEAIAMEPDVGTGLVR